MSQCQVSTSDRRKLYALSNWLVSCLSWCKPALTLEIYLKYPVTKMRSEIRTYRKRERVFLRVPAWRLKHKRLRQAQEWRRTHEFDIRTIRMRNARRPTRTAASLVHRRSAAAPRVTANTTATRGASTPATATRIRRSVSIQIYRRDAARRWRFSASNSVLQRWCRNKQQCVNTLGHPASS